MKITITGLVVLLCFMLQMDLSAQFNSIDTIDRKAEELYNSKNWNGLITYGEKALDRNMDSYTLRKLLGRAYLKKQNYFQSINNLEKAVNYTYEDPENSHYLYNLYRKVNRNEDKNYIFFSMPPGLRKKFKPLENSFIDNAVFFSGIELSNDESKNSATTSSTPYYSEQDFTKNSFYFSIGLNQIPFRWLNVFYDYSYKNTSREKVVVYQNEKVSDEYSRIQNQFYNKFDFRVSEGFIVSPAGHFISKSETVIHVNRDSIFSNDPSILMSLPEEEIFEDNFILSLQLKKYLCAIEISAAGSFSYLNGNHQTQYGAYVNWFLSSNAKFNSRSDFVVHIQDEISNLIFTQLFRAEFNSKLSAKLFGSAGRISNYNEHNGFMVYNNPDVIKYKFGTEVIYYFTTRFTGRLMYEYQSRERELLMISPSSVSNLILNYSVNAITAGLNYFF